MAAQPIATIAPADSHWPDAPREFGRGAVSAWMRPLAGCVTELTPLVDAVRLMAEADVDHLVVVESDGTLAGVVGYRKLIALIANGAYSGPTHVGALVDRAPVTTTSDTPFTAALSLLDPPDITCVVVLEHDRPVGVISESHLAMPSLALVAASL